MLLTSVASSLKLHYAIEKVRKTRRLQDYDQERNTGALYIYKQGYTFLFSSCAFTEQGE